MPKILLEEAILDTLVCPTSKGRIEWCDTQVVGLYLEVRKSGLATYYQRYKLEGKTKHQKLGKREDITLEQARSKAKAVRAELSLAAQPAVTNQPEPVLEESGCITFKKFSLKYYLPAKRNQKRTVREDERMLNKTFIPLYGDLPLDQITRQHIHKFFLDMLARGLSGATCNRHRSLLSHMFNLAIDLELYGGANPVSRIKKYPEQGRERYLTDEELVRLLEAAENDRCRTVALLIKFLLATGCRLGESLKATWGVVDMENRMFTIPAGNAKSGKLRSLPLNNTAMKVLEELREMPWSEGRDHVFINPQTGRRYTCVNRAWRRIRKEAGLPELRLHDLRHNFASQLVNNKVPLFSVQKLLGHSTPVMTEKYAHLSADTLQDASETASIALDEASAKVVNN